MVKPYIRLALARRSLILRLTSRAYSAKSKKEPIIDNEVIKLNELLAKFKDPASHYHIPPGTNGPEHEEDHSSSRIPNVESSLSHFSGDGFDVSRNAAMRTFHQEGYDTEPTGILEWPVAWGDCDMFQHVNNVRFVRWIETARIRYAESLDLPKGQVQGMLSGKGTGFILKDVYLKYIRPVTWPDTVIIATRAHEINQDRASFKLKHAIWSLKDQRISAIGDSTMVMYDYDNLQKGMMTTEFREALEKRTPKSE